MKWQQGEVSDIHQHLLEYTFAMTYCKDAILSLLELKGHLYSMWSKNILPRVKRENKQNWIKTPIKDGAVGTCTIGSNNEVLLIISKIF